jgi:hypothetical protein
MARVNRSANNKLVRSAIGKFVRMTKRKNRGKPGVSRRPGPHSTNTTPAENVNPATNPHKLRKDPPAVYNGGSYDDLKGPDGKNIPGTQINHIPPTQAMNQIPNWKARFGAAIQMDYIDHRAVHSTGRAGNSVLHRADQIALVRNGQVRDAIALDIQDIRRRFGDKYDDALKEMIDKGYPEYGDLKDMLK